MEAGTVIEVTHQRGLYLPAHDLWLDPERRRDFAFVSHAHGDHTAGHASVLATKATARLMRERVPGKRSEYTPEFGEVWEVCDGRAVLLPAGHVLGSAQLYFEGEGGSLLYTGDFKLRTGLSAEKCEWRHAETLIMETTFGLPKHRMPPAEQVLAEMVEWCRAALADGVTPVLLGYALGKAQEIICALIAAGLVPMLHHKVWQMTKLYHELRPDFPKGSVRFDAGNPKGKVLVFPPHLAREKVLDRIKKKRTAVVTGWALDKNVTYRYGCDAAFPLSDHADYDELLRYVELVQPKRVLTVHGFAAEFAADLRRRGIEAWALAQENQLELTLPQ